MPSTTTHTKNSRPRGTSKHPRSDALVILKNDHRTVEKLFKSYERASERAYKTMRRLVDEMITELSVHAFIEEHVLYPAAKAEVPEAVDDVLEAVEEHHVVKWQLRELVGLDPEDERFRPKVTVLIENVRHHVREEETEFFPLLRSEMERRRLLELGDELEAMRRSAPELPHPRLPDGPDDHLVPDAVTSVIDRAKDMVASVRSV